MTGRSDLSPIENTSEWCEIGSTQHTEQWNDKKFSTSQLRQISWVISGRVWRPWSWFRFYRLLFHFWPSYCIWTRANQTLTVIRKNAAAHWHCSRPVNHCTVSFSTTLWWDETAKRRTERWVEGRRERGRREEGRQWEEREGRNHGRIVVCFPTINSRGSGTEQLNIQAAQWGSERGAAVEHCCHHGSEVWNTDDCLYLHRQHGLAHSHTSESRAAGPESAWVAPKLATAVLVQAHLLQVMCTLHYCSPLVDFEGSSRRQTTSVRFMVSRLLRVGWSTIYSTSFITY